jgi:heme exporter protein A
LALVGQSITCVRGERTVFVGLSFRIEAGETLILLGQNGAGKSSLLRLVAGLLRPTTGTIVLDGGDAEQSVGEQAHYLGHQDALKPSLTVQENLTFWVDFLGGARPAGMEAGARADAVADALAAVGLGDLAELPADYLSAGQRRRLSLARLLAVPRPLWLLDEPTAALDIAAQARLAELMQAHLATGGLILVATHGPLGLDRARELRLGAAG